jgi:hypothetical protein
VAAVLASAAFDTSRSTGAHPWRGALPPIAWPDKSEHEGGLKRWILAATCQLGALPPPERPRPEEASVTREQYDAIYTTVLAAQRHDSLPAQCYVCEILAIVGDEVTDNQAADGRPVAAAGARGI